MKRRFTKLTGIILAGTLAATALNTSVVFADEDFFYTEGDAEEVFVEGIEDDEHFSDVSVFEDDNGPDQAADLPSSYNLYELGKLPKIRNQGRYGCCWTFAAVGSAEADLIHDGKAGVDIDLSELQLAYYTSHNFKASKYGMDKDKYYFVPGSSQKKDTDLYLNNTGNGGLAAGMLMSGIGFVSEKDLPYSLAESTSNDACLSDRYAQSLNSAMLTGEYYTSMNNRDTIKQMIMEHGGVNTLIHAPKDKNTNNGECFFSEEYNSYISTYKKVDHAVLIVGWDDDFSRERFPDHMPEEDGAWLVRNSWGYDGYGRNGYFWISYEDASIDDVRAHAFDADTKVYDNCYAYSKTGTIGKYYDYCSSNDKLKVVQNYHVDPGEKIVAAGLEVSSQNVSCEIVVKGKDHTVGNRFSTTLPGYYTTEFESPFEVSDPEGEDVEVIVYYSGKDLRVPFEGKGDCTMVGIEVMTEIESGGPDINNEHYDDLDSKVRLFTDNM